MNVVAVLGHPTYYPRFGFVPSVRYGIKSEYDVLRRGVYGYRTYVRGHWRDGRVW